MSLNVSNSKIGVYVDNQNIRMNGGFGIRFDVLREFACRDNAEAVHLNAYVSYDDTRAQEDTFYKKKTDNFYSKLRDYGYKVCQKNIKWYKDESGNRFGKANSDLDMAVDALLQSEKLDRVLLVTGDGDFVQVVRALQNKGCRVEILAFENVSTELRREADMFLSGYLIPELLPVNERNEEIKWGEIESRVRGYCYHYQQDDNYGFIRFIGSIAPGLWITDARHPDSPYKTAFIHESSIPPNISSANLPNRNIIFEFTLTKGNNEENFQATDVKLANKL